MPSNLEIRDDRRSRSKSPGGRDRSRSRSHSRDTRGDTGGSDRRRSKYDASDNESADDRSSKRTSKKYEEEEEDDSDKRRRRKSKYEEEEDQDKRDRDYGASSRPRDGLGRDDERLRERSRREKKRSDSDEDDRGTSRRKKSDEEEESDSNAYSRYRSKTKTDSDRESGRENGYSGYSIPPPPGAFPTSRHMSYSASPSTDARYSQMPDPRRQSYAGGDIPSRYAEVDNFQYASPNVVTAQRYKDSPTTPTVTAYSQQRPEYERSRPSDDNRKEYERSRPKKYEGDTYDTRSSKYDDRYETREPRRDKRYNDDKYGSSPDDSKGNLTRLAVGGAFGAATLGVASASSFDGRKPPASPLLEAYKGTYQSISPMPSPVMSSALVRPKGKDDSDLSDLDLESEDSEEDEIKRKIRKLEKEKARYEAEQRGQKDPRSNGVKGISPRSSGLSIETRTPERRPRAGSDVGNVSVSASSLKSPGTARERERKKVSFYDPTSDAKRIASALTARTPDPRPLLTILPPLSTDDLLALRGEYKNHAKVGGQGINIAKHIKTRIPGSLGKACYATALGRWESEAFWANSFYQGGASRRELLIESLMGRSNSDIREIKNCFKDKKYNDDLEKCIRTELKADKFRTAILLALEERRMPESSSLDMRLVKSDVTELYRALTAPGGESLLISIIVVRSDAHLREVLRMFEGMYRINFAREMITKSRNLVGETLAHILNGALNRPMRDALLLHQAIAESAPGKERTELLISRLVRMHWEAKHLERVKDIYRSRYGISIEEDIRREVWAPMKTPEGRMCADFCTELVRSSSDAAVASAKSAVIDTREVREFRPGGRSSQIYDEREIEEIRPGGDRRSKVYDDDVSESRQERRRERGYEQDRDRRNGAYDYDGREVREIRPR